MGKRGERLIPPKKQRQRSKGIVRDPLGEKGGHLPVILNEAGKKNQNFIAMIALYVKKYFNRENIARTISVVACDCEGEFSGGTFELPEIEFPETQS